MMPSLDFLNAPHFRHRRGVPQLQLDGEAVAEDGDEGSILGVGDPSHLLVVEDDDDDTFGELEYLMSPHAPPPQYHHQQREQQQQEQQSQVENATCFDDCVNQALEEVDERARNEMAALQDAVPPPLNLAATLDRNEFADIELGIAASPPSLLSPDATTCADEQFPFHNCMGNEKTYADKHPRAGANSVSLPAPIASRSQPLLDAPTEKSISSGSDAASTLVSTADNPGRTTKRKVLRTSCRRPTVSNSHAAITSANTTAAALLMRQHMMNTLHMQEQQVPVSRNAVNPMLLQQLMLRQRLASSVTSVAKSVAPNQNAQNVCRHSPMTTQDSTLQHLTKCTSPGSKSPAYGHSRKRTKTISSAEERQRKRKQQQIKNREAANRSRAKKKQELNDLRIKVGAQAQQINVLKFQVARLEKENQQLKKLVKSQQSNSNHHFRPGSPVNSHIISNQTAGGMRDFFSNAANRGGAAVAAPVTLCAFVFVLCVLTRPLQYVGAFSSDAVTLEDLDTLSMELTDAENSAGHGYLLQQPDSSVFGDSASIFGAVFDGAVSLAASASASKTEVETVALMDEAAVGHGAARRATWTHLALEFIFAVAMAAMTLLSYLIVRFWIQDCHSAAKIAASVSHSVAPPTCVRRQRRRRRARIKNGHSGTGSPTFDV